MPPSRPRTGAIEIREGGLPLQVGSQGELVAEVQRALHISADGIFGVQTDAAVRSYQQAKGLEVDGIVGLVTWGSLFDGQTANGASIGGANIPAAARAAGRADRRSRPAPAGCPGRHGHVRRGRRVERAPGSTTAPGNTTAVSNPGPGSRSVTGCGSSTIIEPVRHGHVPFGPRWGRNHDGVDIGAATGTPVRAAACGTVSLAGQQSGYGNIICITHTSQFSTCYAHLSRFGVSTGAQVQQGQVIGYVGCTGSCTGPHLHFETRVGGSARDPMTYLRGASIPGATATKATATSTTASGTIATASAARTTAAGETVSSTGTAAARRPLRPRRLRPTDDRSRDGDPGHGPRPRRLRPRRPPP